MKQFIIFIISYLIFGILGYYYEYFIFNNKKKCGDIVNKKLDICAPFYNIYGFGGMSVIIARYYFPHINVCIISLILSILFCILECAAGNISEFLSKTKTWNYNNSPLHVFPICNGYVSLSSFIMWMILTNIIVFMYDTLTLFYSF